MTRTFRHLTAGAIVLTASAEWSRSRVRRVAAADEQTPSDVPT